MSRARPTAREIYDVAPSSRAAGEQEGYEKRFFCRVRQKNGVFKTTWAHRFDALNPRVNRLLPPERPIQVMDIAISSGVSTLEWVESLKAAGIDHHMVAGDSSVAAFLVSLGPGLDVLADRDGHPMHFDVFGRGVPSSADTAALALGVELLKRTFAAVFWAQPALGRALRGEVPRFEGRVGISCRPITLVSPRLQGSASIEIVEDDILTNTDRRLERRFHAIRAANILNRDYFDEASLVRSLRNLRSRLRPAGLLIVCRTHAHGMNHGEVFRLEAGGRFVSMERFGEGSEIAPLVLGLEESGDAATD